MNQLTLKTIAPPKNLNAMYLIANQWLKVSTKTTSSGYRTAFITMLDYQLKHGKKHDKDKGKNEKKDPKEEEKEEKRRRNTRT